MHDLRREFGSRLLESGADLHEVRDALGHSSVTMTNAYLASTPVRLSRAFDDYERVHGGEPEDGPSLATPDTVH